MKSKLLIFILAAVLIIVVLWMFFKQPDNTSQVYYYLPELKGKHVEDLKYRKLLSDPSYNQPYNIYVSFKVDSNTTNEELIADLGISKINDSDTSSLRQKTGVKEYEMFFTMQSVNCSRNSTLLAQQKEIDWWNSMENGGVNVMVAGFLFDDLKTCKFVDFNSRHNGRIACCRYNGRLYVFIESWG